MSLRNYIDKIKPNFEEGGKLHAFRSVFDGFETFLFVPNTTAKSGSHIHDAIDSKRIMSMVVIALMPAMLFGMYNVGYQNYAAAGTLATASFWSIFTGRSTGESTTRGILWRMMGTMERRGDSGRLSCKWNHHSAYHPHWLPALDASFGMCVCRHLC